MGFVVLRVTLGQISVRVHLFYVVNIIPTLCHVHSGFMCEMDSGPDRGNTSLIL
jgi:hypothetical protein